MILAMSLLAAASAAVPAAREAVDVRQELDRIAGTCRVPRAWLKLEHGMVHVRPGPGATYRRIDCAFAQLRKSRFKDRLPIAIVGNIVGDPRQ
jgi:hypothetical protein